MNSASPAGVRAASVPQGGEEAEQGKAGLLSRSESNIAKTGDNPDTNLDFDLDLDPRWQAAGSCIG